MSADIETPRSKRLALRASVLITLGIAACIATAYFDSGAQGIVVIAFMALCWSFGIEAARQAVRERRREAAREAVMAAGRLD
ncbi:hypothetical protein [Candidatus Poriferisodalis sp.]|uniref:hypothetical protein n=1 Tax=Candidatus Poriferisodalis sp. TaxID=3101277 RepID=UPI003B0174EA